MILNQHQLNIQSRLSTLIKSKGNVMNLIFFKPRNIGFLMRMIKERLLELFLKREDLASDVRNYVLNNAKKNDPDSVLNTMDEFAKRMEALYGNTGEEDELPIVPMDRDKLVFGPMFENLEGKTLEQVKADPNLELPVGGYDQIVKD